VAGVPTHSVLLPYNPIRTRPHLLIARPAALSKLAAQMIIVAEPSVKPARPVRTGRPHRRVTAAQRHKTTLTDTRTHPNQHSHRREQSNRTQPSASGGPSLRDGPKAGRGQRWVTRGASIPPRRRQRRSGPGAGVKVVHRMRCSTLTPAPGPLRDEPADATGYPLRPHLSCGQGNQRRTVRVLLGAVNSGHLRRAEVQIARRSAVITWHGRQIPKLPTTPTCLRRASASGWSQDWARQRWVTRVAGIPSRRHPEA
jgi:hypothetical protein